MRRVKIYPRKKSLKMLKVNFLEQEKPNGRARQEILSNAVKNGRFHANDRH